MMLLSVPRLQSFEAKDAAEAKTHPRRRFMTAECRIAALESAIPAGDACPISPFGVGMTTASRGLHF